MHDENMVRDSMIKALPALILLAMLIGLSTPAIVHAESNNTNIGYVKYTLLCDNELQSGPLNYTVLCATSPRGIIYDPLNGYIYIADDYANTVDVLDPMNNSIIATISVGLYPYYITYDPKNGYLYVTNNGDYTVSVIDPSTDKVIATIPLMPEIGPIYIPGTLGGYIPGPAGIAYDPKNGYLYVANEGFDNITIIDPSTNKVIGAIQLGHSPWGIAYVPSTGYLYVTAGTYSGVVYVINPSTNQVIATIPVGRYPWGIAYDPENGYLYVTDQGYSGNGNVTVIDTATNKVVTTIVLGNRSLPQDIIYNPANGYIYVVDAGYGAVDVIDPSNNSLIARISLGVGGPWGITYDPKNGYLYVTDDLVGVSIIATKPMPTSNIITPVTKPSVMSTALVVGVVVVVIIVVAAAVMLRMRMRK